MADPERPMRADAARNRARVLEVAYQTLATEGVSVSIDEIARRAGVGAGTVWRHFPTKQALLSAVIVDRMQQLLDAARAMSISEDPRDALFIFLRSMVAAGAVDRGFADAMAGSGIDIRTVAPVCDAEFRALLGDLLATAKRAGTVREDVTVAEVKTLIVGVQAMQAYDCEVADRVTEMAMDGLRPR